MRDISRRRVEAAKSRNGSGNSGGFVNSCATRGRGRDVLALSLAPDQTRGGTRGRRGRRREATSSRKTYCLWRRAAQAAIPLCLARRPRRFGFGSGPGTDPSRPAQLPSFLSALLAFSGEMNTFRQASLLCFSLSIRFRIAAIDRFSRFTVDRAKWQRQSFSPRSPPSPRAALYHTCCWHSSSFRHSIGDDGGAK